MGQSGKRCLLARKSIKVTLEIDIPACVVDVTSRVICALLYDVCRHRIIVVRSWNPAVGVNISHRKSKSDRERQRAHPPRTDIRRDIVPPTDVGKHDATSAGRAAADPAADVGLGG